MQKKLITQPIKYTGEQLRSLWIYQNFGLVGDAIVAFIGSCEILPQRMVDLEDVREKKHIFSTSMLHFIIEHFEQDLEKAILRQYLGVTIIKDLLVGKIKDKTQIQRKGNNLYEGERKITISVATLSPVSSLIHLGINIRSENTPVLTRGLIDYGIEPYPLAEEFLERYVTDYLEIKKARGKVRGVE